MADQKTVDPTTLDWSRFPSALPKAGVVHPTGERKAVLARRVRKAFRGAKAKAEQPA